MNLRGYQREAIDGLYSWFATNDGNPLLVLPTAAGKSVIQATFVHEAVNLYPSTRVLLVSHVKELLEQNTHKLLKVWPDAPVGIYSAGLGSRDVGYQITVAGIQSVHRKAAELGAFDLVMVDECHLIPPSGDGMYRRFIADQRTLNPKVKVIGMTATPFRLKTGRLDAGEEKLFDGVAYEVTVRRLIDEGYLSNLISKRGLVTPDLSDVGTRGGEFIPGQLEAAMDKTALTAAAADEIERLCKDRRSWIIFCAGVEHAHHVRDEFRRRGYTAQTVTGETPDRERAVTLEQFKSGQIRVLTNCDVLTTGFDAPPIDALIMLRPTKSAGLYVQIVGRGMRLSPESGKKNCLVLDFAGNIERHGPIDTVKIKDRTGGDGGGAPAPVKACPECQTIVPISVMTCPECGHQWAEKPKHEATATFADILSQRYAPKEYEVESVSYHLHQKEGKPDSMRVSYLCGIRTHKEWVCFSHTGYARHKAEGWWMQRRKNGEAIPISTYEALLQIGGGKAKLRAPVKVKVSESGKYPEIVGFEFAKDGETEPKQHLPMELAALDDDIPF